MPRIDGLKKVLGAKVYGQDYRACNIDDWPDHTQHAFLIRARHADRITLGVSGLDQLAFTPTVVTSSNLKADGVQNVLLSTPKHADFIGQPIALIVCDSARQLREARQVLTISEGPVDRDIPLQDVHRLPPLGMDGRTALKEPFSDNWFVHYPKGQPKPSFSHVSTSYHNPYELHISQTGSKSSLERNTAARSALVAIQEDIEANDWTLRTESFSTQTTDPAFMEPEGGLAWRNPDDGNIHLLLGTQSPSGDIGDVEKLIENSPTFKSLNVALTTTPPGGGFGGRDKSSFTTYLALAALYATHPVRLSYTREEQFLAGIKRHAAVVHNHLAVDDDGNLRALFSEVVLDGGGESNLTRAVAGLSALHAAGPYNIPRVALNARGIQTTHAPGGSMRGFGIPQVCFAIESMIDDLATERNEDPIAFRKERVLREGDVDVSGMTLEHDLANVKVCTLAGQEPLWANRAAEKTRRDRPHVKYGVGFACCMEAYGTSNDAVLAEVILKADGTLAVVTSGVDMGQGTGTSLAIATRNILGNDAKAVELGRSEKDHFKSLSLFKQRGVPFDPNDPRHVLKLSNSMSASMTAFHHVHAVERAAEVIWEFGIQPAAEKLWGGLPEETQWEGGQLVAPGREALSLSLLAATCHAEGLVTGAMLHTYFRGRHARADFQIGAKTKSGCFFDALLIHQGSSQVLLDRTNATFPGGEMRKWRRSLYASVGHIVAVEVYPESGRVEVVDVVTVLDAGEVHHPELLAGQVEGGFVMGLGMALHEVLPAAPDGFNGNWNFNNYRLPRARHVPMESMKLTMVPLEKESVLKDDAKITKKGVAEACMTTVPPAITNAIAHAVGVRLNRLPVTKNQVKEALKK